MKDVFRTGVKLYTTNPLEAATEAASVAASAAASAGPKAIAEAPKQIMEKSPIMMEKILREKFAIIIDLIEFIELFQGGVKATPEAGAPGGGPALTGVPKATSGGAPSEAKPGGGPAPTGVPGGVPAEATSGGGPAVAEAISKEKTKVQNNPLSPEEIKTKMAELLGIHTAKSDSKSDISNKTDQITKLLFEMDVEKMKNYLSEIRVQFLEFNGFSTKESPVEQMKSLFNQLKTDMENLATKLKTGAEIETKEKKEKEKKEKEKKEKEKGDIFNEMHGHGDKSYSLAEASNFKEYTPDVQSQYNKKPNELIDQTVDSVVKVDPHGIPNDDNELMGSALSTRTNSNPKINPNPNSIPGNTEIVKQGAIKSDVDKNEVNVLATPSERVGIETESSSDDDSSTDSLSHDSNRQKLKDELIEKRKSKNKEQTERQKKESDEFLTQIKTLKNVSNQKKIKEDFKNQTQILDDYHSVNKTQTKQNLTKRLAEKEKKRQTGGKTRKRSNRKKDKKDKKARKNKK